MKDAEDGTAMNDETGKAWGGKFLYGCGPYDMDMAVIEITEDDTDDRNKSNGGGNSAVATLLFPFRKCSSYSFRLPSGAERLILLASANVTRADTG